MKILYSSLLALSISPISADWETIMADFTSNAEAINSLRTSRGEDRAITASDMALVNEYGCWCYFEENHGHGRGNPVDAVDGHWAVDLGNFELMHYFFEYFFSTKSLNLSILACNSFVTILPKIFSSIKRAIILGSS